jgi:uncharacterized membrane protein (UPF0127 family)
MARSFPGTAPNRCCRTVERHRSAARAGAAPAALLVIGLTALCLAAHVAAQSPGIRVSADGIRIDARLEFVDTDGRLRAVMEVEIADTPDARAVGLMGRRHLGENEGMLFIFEQIGRPVIWMRNTPLSLDVIFVSDDHRVVNIAKDTLPMSDSRYHPSGLIKFVVEAPAGFSDRYGIQAGWRLRWQRQ